MNMPRAEVNGLWPIIIDGLNPGKCPGRCGLGNKCDPITADLGLRRVPATGNNSKFCVF